MAKKIFKKGDRVQVTEDTLGPKRGLVGTVRYVSKSKVAATALVEYEGWDKGHDGNNSERVRVAGSKSCWWTLVDQLKLAGLPDGGEHEALAIACYENVVGGSERRKGRWEEEHDGGLKGLYRNRASSMLAALRNPSQKVLDAGLNTGLGENADDIRIMFQAMIDAIMASEKKKEEEK